MVRPKIKVLILYLGHHGFDPRGIIAGAQRVTVEHAEFLAKNGFEVVVMLPLACDDCVYNNVTYINVSDWIGVVKKLKTIKKSWDIIFSVGSPALLKESYIMPYLQFARLRILVIHSGLSGTVEREKIKLINEYTDFVICVSNSIREIFIKYGVNKEKLKVVYNGIDEAIFHPIEGIRQANRIIFAGAPILLKGIDTLFLAFQKVKEKIPQAELVICGSANLHFQSDDKLKKYLPDNSINFLGSVFQDELVKEFSMADLAIFPSSKKYCLEGFPKISIEAQACGCPVIVSDNGGLPETIIEGVTGRVFPSDDVDALARIITELLLDPAKLQAMSKEAEKHIKNKFLLNRTLKPLKTIIKEGIINKRNHCLKYVSKLVSIVLENKNIGFIYYYIC